MNIRQTAPAELDAVMRIYDGARAFMAKAGNPSQWTGGYPWRDLIEEDIALGRSYVCEEDGRLYAVFALIAGEEPDYAVIDGAWLDDLPYRTLHRVASTGERRGMTDIIVEWSLARCANLRADTHEDNLPMQRAFLRNGFRRCGTIWLAAGGPRVAYQRPQNTPKEEMPCCQS